MVVSNVVLSEPTTIVIVIDNIIIGYVVAVPIDCVTVICTIKILQWHTLTFGSGSIV